MTPPPAQEQPRPPAPHVSGDRLGLILGSGISEDDLLTGAHPVAVATPFGPVVVHDVADAVIVVRHRATPDGYRPAHRVDHHRTVAALCLMNCNRVVALGSVGSLGDPPLGRLLAPDDFVALQANPTFHDDGRGHSVPGFHRSWRARVIEAWNAVAAAPVIDGGTYAQTIGPRLETPAEVRQLAAFADVVGMTIASECILAGEAGLAYAALCTVDNMANGLADRPLTMATLHEGTARNQQGLLADLRSALPRWHADARPLDD